MTDFTETLVTPETPVTQESLPPVSEAAEPQDPLSVVINSAEKSKPRRANWKDRFQKLVGPLKGSSAGVTSSVRNKKKKQSNKENIFLLLCTLCFLVALLENHS